LLFVLVAWSANALLTSDVFAQAAPETPSATTEPPADQALEQIPGRWEGVAKVAIVVALFVVPMFLGGWLAKRLRMPEHGWKFAVAIGTIAASLVVVTTGEIKLGPDLSGGITLIYELAEDSGAGQGAGADGEAADAEEEPADRDAASRDDDIEALIAVLSERIDPTGTKEVSIRKYGEGQIEIIIPKATQQELEYIERRIYTAGALIFRITASPLINSHQAVIDLAEGLPPGQDIVRLDRTEVARWVEYDVKEFGTVEQARERGLVTRLSGQTPQALVMTDDGLNVTGEYLRSASPDVDETGRPQVSFTFDSQGAFLFGQLTGNHVPTSTGIEYNLGILLDNRLLSAPTIESKITDRGRISGGSMTEDEVNFIVGILKAGRLPAALNKTPISKAQISPTLGAQTVVQGETAMMITMAMVALFMISYYRFAGFVACFAVASNLLLVVAVMVLIKGAFTMPGLAGLVLTVGMAVDANVLIYERIREELQRGAALRMAIRNGYARAWITIFDSNITTMLTGIVLYKVAPDSVKGFGVTLVLGILLNMFTAVFLTRIVFDVAERSHWLTKLTMAQIIRQPNLDFMGMRKYCVAGLLLVTAVGVTGIVLRGRDLLDIDFTGGTSVTIVLDDAHKMNYVEVQKAISTSPLAGATLVEMDNSRQRYTVTTFNDDVEEVEGILANTFKGKLESYRVEIGPLRAIPGGPVSAARARTRGRLSPWIEWGAPFSYVTFLQDDQADAPDDDSAAETTESAAIDSAEVVDDSSTSGDSTAEDGAGGDSESSAPAEQDEPSPDSADEAAKSTDDPFAGGTEVKLKFGGGGEIAGINHAALEQMLIDVLASAGKPDVGVSLSNPDFQSGSIRNFTEWDLKLGLPEQEARDVLDQLQERINSQPIFPLSNKIGGRVAGKMAIDAIAAAVLCCLGLVGYLWFRFHGVMYGIAAVIALVFDIVIVVGAVALSAYLVDAVPSLTAALQLDKFKLDLALVAALLTLLGYCINDTIVVFDRIREVKGKSPRLTGDMINLSINQTLSRTLLTGMTTIGSVIVLYIVAGEGIHGFAFALFIGFIVGTFGSIFIASPVLLWLSDRVEAAGTARRSKAA
jgi:SecD/SecF fusion protein